MNATISLKEYLEKGKTFVIPQYQRGYIWGQKRIDGSKDSVSYMMDSLISGYKAGNEVFIQGVTVSESDKEIILIDGQQRTTFFYLLLKLLGYDHPFKVKYEVREQSDKFLLDEGLLAHIEEDPKEAYQDIYFFKKTLRIIEGKLRERIEPEAFREYILNKVKFLYIAIPIEKATTVFTMMNGNKAIMKPEELIKAEMLRIASLGKDSDAQSPEVLLSEEWENNMLRSRYAREWDKWLQWWNRPDVKALFKVDRVMGLLISTYYTPSNKEEGKSLSFEVFRKAHLPSEKPLEAKQTFDNLRRLQKRFEDAYYDPKSYNQIGAILRIQNGNDARRSFIRWYFAEERRSAEELDRYYRLSFLGLTHKEITKKSEDNDEEDRISVKYDELLEDLGNDLLYEENKEAAFRLLLRLNIDEDNKQFKGKGRKFDFSIWDNNTREIRSLEHIYPKSKVYHEAGQNTFKDGNNADILLSNVDNTYIKREDCVWTDGKGTKHSASEHSIGNLVLLYSDDNSSFSNKSYQDKKKLFFHKESLKSRHLLHTISLFAESKWAGKEIANNKYITLEAFKNYYKNDVPEENEQK